MEKDMENSTLSNAFSEKHEQTSLDRSWDGPSLHGFPDEMPSSGFTLSPGRSISPIDFMLDLDSKSISLQDDDDLEELCQPISLNFVSLSEIDAQITPLKAKAKGLQTIFEGVFLETPPRSGGRTVIPRKTCDPRVGSDSSSSDEDDQVTPLCDSYIDGAGEEEQGGYDAPQLIRSRCSTSRGASTAASSTSLSSICNSFQRRLNLIPGED